jgi:hypothetical protein
MTMISSNVSGGRFYNHLLLVKYVKTSNITYLHLLLGCAMYQWTVSQQSLCQESKDHPGISKDRDVVCSCDIQGRKHVLWVTCFNEQAKLLLNDNHPLVLCALQDSAMLPLSEEETIRLATCNWELHFCTVVTLLVQRSMKLKKKGRFVNFVEYV